MNADRNPQPSEGVRLGIDIGGTFTDVVAVGESGVVWRVKVPSTPEDFAQAVEGVLERWRAAGGGAVAEIVHGTTVATNAILEGKGARTALVTTRGFRDVLEIGRLRTPRLYDLTWEKPRPLVARRLRFEVEERVGADGEVVRPLDPEQSRCVLRQVLGAEVEAIAICLLHSYANSVHERELARLLAEEIAKREAAGCGAARPFVSLSYEVLPEIKEYERTSTTVINATLQPVVSRYLASLEARAAAQCPERPPVRVMQSNGGVMSAGAAAERPIHIIESGPAAGVIAALALARRIGEANVLTLDMGGTTAKASLIEGGALMRSPEYEVGAALSVGSRLQRGGGYPVRVPAIDLAEVGAGGGSVIRADASGRLRVGPESAGAVPGPACYALGGEAPTLTDANVVLGYLHPAHLAGGAVLLDAERAWQAITEQVARPLGLEAREAAHGAHRVAVAGMARAARAVSVERGRDPRGYLLVAFGGNGPLHAVELARALGMRRILIPPEPGLFSAVGLLCAETERHEVRTYKRRLADLDAEDLVRQIRAMEDAVRAAFQAEGQSDASLRVARTVDLRYVGQSYELGVPLDETVPVTADLQHTLASAFAAEHARRYGHAAPEDPIEVVNLRVVASVPRLAGETRRRGDAETQGGGGGLNRSAPGPSLPSSVRPDVSGSRSTRECYFGRELGLLPAAIHTRASLTEAQPGPLVIDEYDATILVPLGATARCDGWGNVLIDA